MKKRELSLPLASLPIITIIFFALMSVLRWKAGHYLHFLSYSTNTKYQIHKLTDAMKGDIHTQLYLNKKEIEIHTHVELKDMAYIDPLTGTTNHHKFDELSEDELERSNRYKNKLSFLMLDIDYFNK